MRLAKPISLLLCIVFCVVLFAACGEQAAEEPAVTQPTTETIPLQTESNTEPEDKLEEDELPALTFPQATEPVTEDTAEPEPSQPADEEKPQATEVSKPSEPTEPTEPTTTQSETTPSEPQPETEAPEATEPTEPPILDEDELPPVPVF